MECSDSFRSTASSRSRGKRKRKADPEVDEDIVIPKRRKARKLSDDSSEPEQLSQIADQRLTDKPTKMQFTDTSKNTDNGKQILSQVAKENERRPVIVDSPHDICAVDESAKPDQNKGTKLVAKRPTRESKNKTVLVESREETVRNSTAVMKGRSVSRKKRERSRRVASETDSDLRISGSQQTQIRAEPAPRRTRSSLRGQKS